MTLTTERKYALIKVAAGDYILPSNDTKTLWRISRYTDGPSTGLEIPRDREFWAVWRWPGPGRPKTVEDLEDWTLWEHMAGSLDTRAEAIKEAMRLS